MKTDTNGTNLLLKQRVTEPAEGSWDSSPGGLRPPGTGLLHRPDGVQEAQPEPLPRGGSQNRLLKELRARGALAHCLPALPPACLTKPRRAAGRGSWGERAGTARRGSGLRNVGLPSGSGELRGAWRALHLPTCSVQPQLPASSGDGAKPPPPQQAARTPRCEGPRPGSELSPLFPSPASQIRRSKSGRRKASPSLSPVSDSARVGITRSGPSTTAGCPAGSGAGRKRGPRCQDLCHRRAAGTTPAAAHAIAAGAGSDRSAGSSVPPGRSLHRFQIPFVDVPSSKSSPFQLRKLSSSKSSPFLQRSQRLPPRHAAASEAIASREVWATACEHLGGRASSAGVE